MLAGDEFEAPGYESINARVTIQDGHSGPLGHPFRFLCGGLDFFLGRRWRFTLRHGRHFVAACDPTQDQEQCAWPEPGEQFHANGLSPIAQARNQHPAVIRYSVAEQAQHPRHVIGERVRTFGHSARVFAIEAG